MATLQKRSSLKLHSASDQIMYYHLKSMNSFDTNSCKNFVHQQFQLNALPSLMKYIEIPNTSRSYDVEWESNGLLAQAAEHLQKWIVGVGISGLRCEIIKDQGYSPLIFTQIPGTIDKTLLFYGHFDKQPPFTGWDEDLGPCKPVIKDGKLYGRGGADDGYATYGTMLAIKAVQEQGIPLPRCVMITEGDEESGSGHMPHYLQKLKDRIGTPEVTFCLDSGGSDYNRFWITNSLRGNLVGTLSVKILRQGVHSGDSSGVVPSCFRIANQLFARLQDVQTGKINKKFRVEVPPKRYDETHRIMEIMGEEAIADYPFTQGAQRMSDDQLTLMLNRTWEPTLTVTGQSGFPDIEDAGNVMLPCLEYRFSLRMPPSLNSDKAVEDLTELLTNDPPYGAEVQLKNVRSASGWSMKDYDKYLEKLIDEASDAYFGNEKLCAGRGGSIPVVGMIGKLWPQSQFIITGVLGPGSNAHGPNEFLHLQFTQKLICSIAHVIGGISLHINSA